MLTDHNPRPRPTPLPGTSARVGTTETDSVVRPVGPPAEVIDGRYRVLGRVGAGSMGVVLAAEDLTLHRAVAIKLVEPRADPAIAQRFIKEAQALARVRHENVVQVYAFGEYHQASYLAMELVVGESLEAVIDGYLAAKTTMPLVRALTILRSIVLGLEAVHAQHLVHRDVKPGNIIIEKDTDRPVLIDFGLARRRTASNPRMSITGGTPSYMAPEQSQEDPTGTAVSARTDLYALACTAFEMLTGRPVFEGNDIYSVLISHMRDQPRRISTLRPELAPLDDVFLRALAKDPAARYGSASDWMLALEARLSLIGPAVSATAPRVLVLATDTGLRRSLVRNVTSTFRGKGVTVVCETADTAAQAVTLIAAGKYALFLADEESAEGRTAELVRAVRDRRPDVDVVLVSRDLSATAKLLGDDRVRHVVPKPLNVHFLTAVLDRTGLANSANVG